jgi:hypothetical protein
MKTLYELRLIEALPELHITPDLLLRTGLIKRKVTTEQYVLYFKCVQDMPDTISRFAKSANLCTANKAAQFETFLNSTPTSDHILRFNTPDRNPSQPYPFHVGRLSQGVEARREHERREQNT